VNSLGGKWSDDATLNHGVIRDGAATVYINKSRAASAEYSDDELAEFITVLGGAPMEVVSIDIGHGEGSLDLARNVAKQVMNQWNGMIDGNNVIDSITRVR
jgi:hypothetical protein